MDLQNIGEFHCAVCFERFGENRRCPRMLTCGHSFCQSCLESLLVQSPSCPNCKQGIQFPNVDCIPVNYIVKSVVSRFNVNESLSLNEQNSETNSGLKEDLKEDAKDSLPLKKELSSLELPYEGYCEDHHIYKHLRCMDCKCWVCGVCATLSHKPCRTLLVAEALKEMKLLISQEVNAEIETQKFQNEKVDIHLKYLENDMSSLKKEIKQLQLELSKKIESLKSFGKNMEKLQLMKSESKKHCTMVKLLETSVITSANYEQFINATSKLNEFLDQSRKLLGNLTLQKYYLGHPISIKVLKDWGLEKAVYAFHCENGSNLYGKVDVKGDRVWIHCFVSQKPRLEDVVIPFTELLTTFNGSTDLPKRGFIQIDDGTSPVSDVIIATDALTPRAMNFLLLCSGIKGRSYEGISLSRTDGRGMILTSSNGEAVVEGITNGGVYEAPRKKGFVCGWEAEDTNSLSGFFIWMEDEPEEKLETKFGFVEEGIEVCERICSSYGKDVVIKSCGLVI